ncbi:MAG: alanine--glyoxylate aminotransferase family protein, partial [Ilumatobacter sp.]|nr:alanine--glyoxylate aminotransferase family protein [Ilumatobacter sp.]
DRALGHLRDTPQSWYLDLNMIAKYVTGDGARAYHHTAPISSLYGLHAGLGAILDEGLDVSFARHQAVGDALQAGLVDRGFRLFAAEGNRLPQLTSVWVPEERLPSGSTEADVRRSLLLDYGVEIGGGLGDLAGKGWRIGLMGHTARMRNVQLLLASLDDVLV